MSLKNHSSVNTAIGARRYGGGAWSGASHSGSAVCRRDL